MRLVQWKTVYKSYEVREAFQEKTHGVVQQLGKLGPYHLATPACVKGIIAHLFPFEKKHIFRHGRSAFPQRAQRRGGVVAIG